MSLYCRRLSGAFLGGLLAATAWAADVGGPSSQFFFDAPSRAIRAVWAYGGAARLGPAVVEDVDFASIAPDSKRALVRRGEDIYWLRLDPQMNELNYVGGMVTGFTLTAWSADGRCIAVYSPVESRAQRLCDSSFGPQIEDSVPFGTQEEVRALALNRDGSILAVAGSQAVYAFSASFGWQQVADVPSPAAIAFGSNPDSLLIASPAAGLVEVPHVGTGLAAAVLLPAEAMGGAPNSVFEAGGLIYLATSDDPAVVVFSRQANSVVRREPVDSALNGLHPISPGVFLSSRVSTAEPLLLIDISRKELVFFVPVTQ